MKIACIIHSLDGGGAERVMAGLASRLAHRGHEVTLITLDDGSIERHPVAPEVARKQLDMMFTEGGRIRKWSKLLARLRTLRTAVREAAPEVVLSFCDRTNILALAATAGLGLPVVVGERSDPEQQRLSRLWEWMRRRTYPRAATIVTLTLPVASYLRQWLSAPIVVIPSAVDVAPLHSDRAAASVRKTIVGMGRLEPEKGFDRLIDAFAEIIAHSPKASEDWSLRIYGEGSMRPEYQKTIADFGLTNRVFLPGWTAEPWQALAEATIFALPSRYEGFPSALLEAMAAGVPSVAVDCPSGPRAILDSPHAGPSTSALLVPNQTHALADGLLNLMKDDDRREAIGQAGIETARRFGWDEMVSRYEQVLQEAVAGNRAQRGGS